MRWYVLCVYNEPNWNGIDKLHNRLAILLYTMNQQYLRIVRVRACIGTESQLIQFGFNILFHNNSNISKSPAA